jgi:hypothetical protein
MTTRHPTHHGDGLYRLGRWRLESPRIEACIYMFGRPAQHLPHAWAPAARDGCAPHRRAFGSQVH